MGGNQVVVVRIDREVVESFSARTRQIERGEPFSVWPDTFAEDMVPNKRNAQAADRREKCRAYSLMHTLDEHDARSGLKGRDMRVMPALFLCGRLLVHFSYSAPYLANVSGQTLKRLTTFDLPGPAENRFDYPASMRTTTT